MFGFKAPRKVCHGVVLYLNSLFTKYKFVQVVLRKELKGESEVKILMQGVKSKIQHSVVQIL